MPENFWTVFIGAALLALIAAAVTCTVIVLRYKRKLRSPIYPIDRYASMSLNARRDDFIGATVTSVKLQSNKRK